MINTSSKTKTSLNRNRLFTEYPNLLLGNARHLVLAAVTLGVFVLLVKLGFWQLSRAEEKELWQAELSHRQSLAPFSFEQLLAQPPDIPLTGFTLTVDVTPVNQQIFLLDNQIYQGKVGYLAYQLMSVDSYAPWLLVELGFVEASARRDTLPQVMPLVKQQRLSGRLYQRQNNPVSHQLMPENGTASIRFQNLNLPQLADFIQHPLVATVLQPDAPIGVDINGSPLAKPWQPIPLSAQKHRGYALQWFSMAVVFMGLMGWTIWRTVTKKKRGHGENKAIAMNKK